MSPSFESTTVSFTFVPHFISAIVLFSDAIILYHCPLVRLVNGGNRKLFPQLTVGGI